MLAKKRQGRRQVMGIKLLIGCVEQAWGLGLCQSVHAARPGSFEFDVSTVEGVVREAAALRPDVVLLERPQAAEGGQELVGALAWRSAGTRVLLVCEAWTRELVIAAIEGGAKGCLHKDTPIRVLIDAVQAVYRGETWFSRSALLQALRTPQEIQTKPVSPDCQLTPREDQILHLIGAGLSNKEIGRRLEISDQTVKTHLHHIYVKLQRSGRYKAFLAQPGAAGVLPQMAAAMSAGAGFAGAQLREE
jgi:DNA-binding NarL/FixJ family response regulator